MLRQAQHERNIFNDFRPKPVCPESFDRFKTGLSKGDRFNNLLACLWLFVLLAAAPTSVSAHTRSQSFSSWYIDDGQVRLSFSVPALEVTRLGLLESGTSDLKDILVRHLAAHMMVRAGDAECRTLAGPRASAAREGYVRVEWRFFCPATETVEVFNNSFFDVASSHVHYARVRVGERRPVEYLFTNTERRRLFWADGWDKSDQHGAPFVAYLWLGVEHILVGVDHLAFLLALLLPCRCVREVLYLVTGFTLGHSLTLSLATLGVVNPNVPTIEALIGFTIALVAAENIGVTTGATRLLAWVMSGALAAFALLESLLPLGVPLVTLIGLALFTSCYLLLIGAPERALRGRPTLTVLFGLIHGFGFASVLLEIGLPTDRLIAALLGFNLGVEMGQLGIVSALWLIGYQITGCFSSVNYRFIRDVTSAVLCALGLFWFVGRALSA